MSREPVGHVFIFSNIFSCFYRFINRTVGVRSLFACNAFLVIRLRLGMGYWVLCIVSSDGVAVRHT
jgi:hypothetical protein